MNETGAPAVGAVIINYNGAAFVGALVESLLSVQYAGLRILIVDSASSDGSLQELQRLLPEAAFAPCAENVGTAAGNNIGARHWLDEGADYILFLNNDTVLTPDFLSKLVDAADNRTVVVPKILYHDDPSIISTHAGDFDWRLGLFRNTFHGRRDGPQASRPRELQTASFCCALTPAQAFREAGFLDERFFMYYEETDWLRRALEQGYRLRYVPHAVIYHRESASSGPSVYRRDWMSPFKLYYATRNRPYLLKKASPSRRAWAAFTAYFLAGRAVQLLAALLRGRRRMARALALGVLDYYRGCMGRTLEVGEL